MSKAKQAGHIFYNDNNWNDVVEQYDLKSNLEVTIRESDTHCANNENKPSSNNHWITRVFIFTGILSLVGNLPVQSSLVKSTTLDTTHSFEINTPSIIANNLEFNKQQHLVKTIQLQATIDTDESVIPTMEDIIIEPQELTLPKRALETYAGHAEEETSSKWKTYRVKSYDNLTNIFYKLGHQNILSTLKKDENIAKQLSKLTKGTTVRASSVEGKLSELVFSSDNINSYVLSRTADNKYSGSWKKNLFEVRQSRASFTIRNGLFFDGKKSGINNHIIKQIVKVFDWDIDFSHDVRVGDKVTAVYEEVFHDGDKVGYQHLLAAEFINKGREFRAVRYTYPDGKSDYFTPEGREMKKAFIRTPISHARVSSHFNPGRFHPVLHKIRAHKGTDFSARTGTPIMATGNGTVTSLGRKGGYGRAIVIKHREGYTTLYAHMSRYNKKLKKGDKVYQGDLIGYVGSSGYATGPHLHYEFRKNKKAIDPMKASLPNSMSLSSRELQDFRNKAINLVLQLNVLNRFAKAKIAINSAFGG